MRKNIFRIALVAAFVSTIISCQKNDDTTPSSGGGTPTLDRDKFLSTTSSGSAGPWHVTSHHSPSGQTLFWTLTIVAGSSSNEILLDNFDQMGETNSIRATVSGNSFSIPQQTGPDSTVYQGSGTYSNNTLTFSYTADDQANPVDNVTATASR